MRALFFIFVFSFIIRLLMYHNKVSFTIPALRIYTLD